MTKLKKIDCGGYLCTNSICVLIAAWLDASQRRDGVQLNRSAKGVKCKVLREILMIGLVYNIRTFNLYLFKVQPSAV
ncbi:hypothetical protein NP493_402g04021 [Ridgeia piscesae]|uniref:Uncharacterized protein n=1 Tax=Ridgeia piscesae TaxID=27915 RepID=A0AAD9L124_RIDPI|nr:hypothetical protein NP493_402g04021 [Ridgeia piscesae]